MDTNDICSENKSEFVLKSDAFHLNRILTRESSVGQSSRIYYRNVEGGVPFKWEMQPGTPKNPPTEEVIPPPTPPPAVQSSWLPKPASADKLNKDSSNNSFRKLWFWKKHKKMKSEDHAGDVMRLDMNEKFEFGDSDGEFIGSCQNSRDSVSSSSSSSNGHHHSLHQSGNGRDGPFSCGPWNMTDLLFRITRRV